MALLHTRSATFDTDFSPKDPEMLLRSPSIMQTAMISTPSIRVSLTSYINSSFKEPMILSASNMLCPPAAELTISSRVVSPNISLPSIISCRSCVSSSESSCLNISSLSMPVTYKSLSIRVMTEASTGIEIKKIISLPASSTFVPIAACPASLHSCDVKSDR